MEARRDYEEYHLENIRILHARLSLTVDEVNKCYVCRLTFFLNLCFIEMSANFLQYIYHYGLRTTIALVFFTAPFALCSWQRNRISQQFRK